MLDVSLQIQHPTNGMGKAMTDIPSIQTPYTRVGHLEEAPIMIANVWGVTSEWKTPLCLSLSLCTSPINKYILRKKPT